MSDTEESITIAFPDPNKKHLATEESLDRLGRLADEAHKLGSITLHGVSGVRQDFLAAAASSAPLLIAELRRLKRFEEFVRERFGDTECPVHGTGTAKYPCPEDCPYGVGRER